MNIQVGGIFGFFVLVADIWAILNVVQSYSTNTTKLLWVLLILFLPLFGFLIWLFLGPRGRAI